RCACRWASPQPPSRSTYERMPAASRLSTSSPTGRSSQPPPKGCIRWLCASMTGKRGERTTLLLVTSCERGRKSRSSIGSRVDANARDDAADGPAGARCVGEQALADREEEPEQLAEPHVERRAMVVGELAEIEREKIVDEPPDVRIVIAGDGDDGLGEFLFLHLFQEIDLVRAQAAVAREKRHEQRFAIDERERTVADAEEGFGDRGHAARRHLEHLECRFAGHAVERAGTEKTRAG